MKYLLFFLCFLSIGSANCQFNKIYISNGNIFLQESDIVVTSDSLNPSTLPSFKRNHASFAIDFTLERQLLTNLIALRIGYNRSNENVKRSTLLSETFVESEQSYQRNKYNIAIGYGKKYSSDNKAYELQLTSFLGTAINPSYTFMLNSKNFNQSEELISEFNYSRTRPFNLDIYVSFEPKLTFKITKKFSLGIQSRNFLNFNVNKGIEIENYSTINNVDNTTKSYQVNQNLSQLEFNKFSYIALSLDFIL